MNVEDSESKPIHENVETLQGCENQMKNLS